MDEETYKRQREFAGEKKPSMLRRCVGHDYTERRMYMITMVTEGRRALFGSVVGDCMAQASSQDAPHIELSPLGQCVVDNWQSIHERYPQIELVALQMMPDHLHGILFVKEKLEKHLGQALSGFKAGCNKDYRRLVLGLSPSVASDVPPLVASGVPPSVASGVPPSVVSGVPSSVASGVALPQQTKASPRQRPPRSTYDRNHGLLFASGYNDKLLLREGQLEVWKNYLRDNPRRLLVKRTRPDLFRVRFGLSVAGQTYSALGNQFLLSRPIRIAVQCSRRMTEAEIKLRVDEAMAAAQAGAVHVSPAISPGEKAVMRALLNAHYPLIYLEENGLTPYTKPGGEFFEACNRGHLLILAPWEHHNERILITRDKCLALNEMAKTICS